MRRVAIELAPPADRQAGHWARSKQISPEQAVQELIALGFETRLRELYARSTAVLSAPLAIWRRRWG